MTALNTSFTDTEIAAVRRAADAAEVPVDTFIRDASGDSADARRTRVDKAALLVAHHSSELNTRLA